MHIARRELLVPAHVHVEHSFSEATRCCSRLLVPTCRRLHFFKAAGLGRLSLVDLCGPPATFNFRLEQSCAGQRVFANVANFVLQASRIDMLSSSAFFSLEELHGLHVVPFQYRPQRSM